MDPPFEASKGGCFYSVQGFYSKGLIRMNMFANSLRRKLCHKDILYAVVLSLLIMFVSFFVEASLEIRTLMQDLFEWDLCHPYTALYTQESLTRIKEFTLENDVSQAFSFYIFMEDGFIIYNF